MLCTAAHLWVSFCRLFLGTMLYQTDGDDVTRLCVGGGGEGEARRRSFRCTPFFCAIARTLPVTAINSVCQEPRGA